MMVNICRREASVTVGFFSEGYLGLWFVKSKKRAGPWRLQRGASPLVSGALSFF